MKKKLISLLIAVSTTILYSMEQGSKSEEALTSKTSCYFLLPVELRSYIISFLPDIDTFKEFINLQLVNKEFKEFASAQAFINEYAKRIALHNSKRAEDLLLAAAKHGHIALTQGLFHANDNMKIFSHNLLRLVVSGSFEGFKNQTENHKIITTLLQAKVNPNAQDQYGQTPLMKTDNFEIAKLLIVYGADINAKNNEGETALIQATALGINRILLNHGADANIQDNNGNTPLMLAILENRIQTVKLLLSNNALVNLQNHIGGTALMVATMKGYTDIAKLLIKHGSDINLTDAEGRTALDVALEYNKPEMVKLLEETKNNSCL